MDKRIFKDKVYSMLASLVKALANPHRLEIIDLLGQGEKRVEEIAGETGMSIANTSQHLQVLKSATLLEMRREGNFIYYRIAHDEIYRSWQALRELGMGRVAEIEKLVKDFRERSNTLEVVTLDQLQDYMKSKNVILLDVRPEKEYRKGHIPGSINIYIKNLPTALKKLSPRKEYIAYCRGPFCVFADEAVNLLSQKGFKARRLAEGFPDWKMKGLPYETLEDML